MSIASIIDEIADMTVGELVDLTNQLSARFGIKMVPSVNQTFPGTGGGERPPFMEEFEPELFDVYLDDAGANRVQVIKLIRAHIGLGLKEAKDLVDTAPCLLLSNQTHEETAAFIADLIGAGATASNRPVTAETLAVGAWA